MVSDLPHHKSVGLDGIHSRTPSQLAEVLIKPPSIIFQQFWLTAPADSNLAIMTPMYKKGQKEDDGKYRPVSSTLVLEKMMEQIALTIFMQHVIGQPDDQASVSMGLSCLMNLIPSTTWSHT